MPKTERPKGEYHYAIQALESRLAKIRANPDKFKKPYDRIASITAALDVLVTNNLPPKPVPLSEIFDAEEARRAAEG